MKAVLNYSDSTRLMTMTSNKMHSQAHNHHYPEHVTLVEVGPRDGLQNEKNPTSVEDRVRLINQLSQAGLNRIEAGSFVSPKWVPQMANTDQVLATLNGQPRHNTDTRYSVLTPNMRGLNAALDANAREVAVFGAASESFTQKNINMSIDESLSTFEPLVRKALDHNIAVRGYVSCVLGCPYEGEIQPKKVELVSRALLGMGCYEVSLGDTIGVGTPMKTQRLLEQLLIDIPTSNLAVHFHDTYGQALANILIALQMGINVIDSAVAGLGGCPYAKGASGNVATEDVLFMLNGMGIHTGVDLNTVQRAGIDILNKLERTPQSKVSVALNEH